MPCQLYIRLVDKVPLSESEALHHQNHQAGDVVVVVPENHAWGRLEMASQNHAIVPCDMDLEDAAAFFCPPEPEEEVENPYRHLRAGKIELSLLPGPLRSAIAASKLPEHFRTRPFAEVRNEFLRRRVPPALSMPDAVSAFVIKPQVRPRIRGQ